MTGGGAPGRGNTSSSPLRSRESNTVSPICASSQQPASRDWSETTQFAHIVHALAFISLFQALKPHPSDDKLQEMPKVPLPAQEQQQSRHSTLIPPLQALCTLTPTIGDPSATRSTFLPVPNIRRCVKPPTQILHFYFPANHPNLLNLILGAIPATTTTLPTTTAQSCIPNTPVLNVVCVAAHTVASISSNVTYPPAR